MSSRGFSSACLTYLNGDSVEFYYLLSIGVSTPIYHTTCPYDVTYDTKTWVSDATISGLPNTYKEKLNLSPNSISIEMAGASLANYTTILTENMNNVDVKVYLYVPEYSEASIVWQGRIKNHAAEENIQEGKSIIKLNCENIFNQFNDIRGRMITDEEQQRLYSGDTGFKYVQRINDNLSDWNSSGDADGSYGFIGDTIINATTTFAEGVGGVISTVSDSISSLFGGGGGGARKIERGEAVSDNLAILPGKYARLPVVYGQQRIKPVKFFQSLDPDDDSILYVGYLICEGEIDSITDILLGDFQTSYSGAPFSSNVTLSDSTTGTTTQAASATLISVFSSKWSSADQLKGCATAVVKYNRGDMFKGDPSPIFVIKGKKCYDPRDGTTAWTENPVLHLWDYLTDTNYGMGIDTGLLDSDLFGAAADVCDTQVYDHDESGGGTKAYINLLAMNGVINTSKNIKDNIAQIEWCMRGNLAWSAGKFYPVIEQTGETSVYSFDDDNTKSFKFATTKTDDQYNTVYYDFIDPNNNYYMNNRQQSSTAYLTADNGIVNYKHISNLFENNEYRAYNRAGTELKKSRSAYRIGITASNVDAIQIQAGDIFDVTRESLGWANKKFRATSISISRNGEVSLEGKEYTSTDFDWSVSVEYVPPADTVLPDIISERIRWQSAVTVGYKPYRTSFDTLDGLVTQDVTLDSANGLIDLDGGNSTDSYAYRYLNAASGVLTWDKERTIKISLTPKSIAGTAGSDYSYIGIGDHTGTNFIGLRITSFGASAATVQIISKNSGGTSASSSTTLGFSPGIIHEITIKYKPSDGVYSNLDTGLPFYTKLNVTSNLPSGTTNAEKAMHVFVGGNVPGPYRIYLTDWEFIQHSF